MTTYTNLKCHPNFVTLSFLHSPSFENSQADIHFNLAFTCIIKRRPTTLQTQNQWQPMKKFLTTKIWNSSTFFLCVKIELFPHAEEIAIPVVYATQSKAGWAFSHAQRPCQSFHPFFVVSFSFSNSRPSLLHKMLANIFHCTVQT